MSTQQTMAGLKELQALSELAHSEQPFLTLFLNTEGESLPSDVHARLRDLAWATKERYSGTRWATVAERERERVLPLIDTLKPIGSSVLIVSSEAADILEAQWLPGPVEDHARVGQGVYALPLLDLLDEFEPVAVAFVEHDKARLLLTAAGRVIDAQHFTADIPGRERAGGWHAASYDRHRKELARKHLHEVAEALTTFHEKHHFNRLLLGGPTEPLGVFKGELTTPISQLVSGEIGIDSHASDAHIAEQVVPLAERLEREGELRIVQDIVVAAEKGQGAVLGTALTLGALHDGALHTLVLDPLVELKGTYCPACDRLLPAEELRCPVCGGEVETIDLREELPRHLPSRGTMLEMVHGDAATELWEHGSIGGRLKVQVH